MRCLPLMNLIQKLLCLEIFGTTCVGEVKCKSSNYSSAECLGVSERTNVTCKSSNYSSAECKRVLERTNIV
ncbi:hypothetical protein DPMN_162606 [Dreissena polymorpha]|uniref:Uncharacterized protein n=1 Tax=Dreissena polymorpha TaxID=45954 RepID=A0A9D4ERZ2_DREPO|nr:hypothetical protein DPMN_162606 [Dreissena polymorpha]